MLSYCQGVLRFNAVDVWAAKKYAELYPSLFPSEEMGKSNQTNASLFIEKLSDLSKELGLPQKLRDVSIPRMPASVNGNLKTLMKQTRLLVNNPREVTEQDACDIYHSIW